MQNLNSLTNLSSLGNVSNNSGNKYLLYDTFTTAVAAGSVNGTLAEPVGGARTVVDTLTGLSITGGQLVKASAANTGVGDPGIWWPSLARASGRMLIGTHVTGNYSNYSFGWDSNQSGGIIGAINFQTSAIMRINDGTFTLSVGVPPGGVSSNLCVITRSTGYYYFIQDSVTYTNWTLLWVSPNNSSGIFPNIASNTNATNAFTFDNVRIPKVFWVPTPLAYDTFTRANGVLGSSETTGPDGQTVTALSWTSTLGTWAVATNAAAASATSGGSAFATVDAGVADIIIDAAVTRSAGVAGIVLRYANSTNYIIAYHDGTNAKLDKVIAGSTTNVLSAVATYSAGATLRVIASGTGFRLFYNNAAVGALGTIADAAVQTTTVHGLYTTDTSNSLDGFLIMPRGTNNEYAALNSF